MLGEIAKGGDVGEDVEAQEMTGLLLSSVGSRFALPFPVIPALGIEAVGLSAGNVLRELVCGVEAGSIPSAVTAVPEALAPRKGDLAGLGPSWSPASIRRG